MEVMAHIKNGIKSVFGSRFALQSLCRLLPGPHVIVLGFHDVCEDDALPSWLRVKKSCFSNMLDQLGEYCNFIHPQELFNPSALSQNQLNLLLTFDDGFANNWRVAAPIMRKRGIPGIFFISTDNVQHQSLFWFDKIIIPIQALKLSEIDLTPLGFRMYRFSDDGDEKKRWDSIQSLLKDVKQVENPDHPSVQAVISWFETTFQSEIHHWENDFRPMTQDEVYKLSTDPLFHVGSHSHHHVILTLLEPCDVVLNLRRSKQILETLTGVSVDSFACPNGNTTIDINSEIEKAGYRFAYGIHNGIVSRGTNPLQIPRILVGGYDELHDLVWKFAKAVISLKRIKR